VPLRDASRIAYRRCVAERQTCVVLEGACVVIRQPRESTVMRRLVTGIDNQGRSCVVSDVEVEFAVREDRGVVAVEQLYATDELPLRLHSHDAAQHS
jgi:hypothetical protein